MYVCVFLCVPCNLTYMYGKMASILSYFLSLNMYKVEQ